MKVPRYIFKCKPISGSIHHSTKHLTVELNWPIESGISVAVTDSPTSVPQPRSAELSVCEQIMRSLRLRPTDSLGPSTMGVEVQYRASICITSVRHASTVPHFFYLYPSVFFLVLLCLSICFLPCSSFLLSLSFCYLPCSSLFVHLFSLYLLLCLSPSSSMILVLFWM